MSTKNTTEALDWIDLFGTTDKPLQRIMLEDLADVPRDELIHQFREAYGVLEGFKLVAAEALGVATYTVLNDAQARTAQALKRLGDSGE